MTPEEHLNEQLKKASTIREVFFVINTFYNTDEKLSFVQKTTLVAGLKNAVRILSVKPR